MKNPFLEFNVVFVGNLPSYTIINYVYFMVIVCIL